MGWGGGGELQLGLQHPMGRSRAVAEQGPSSTLLLGLVGTRRRGSRELLSAGKLCFSFCREGEARLPVSKAWLWAHLLGKAPSPLRAPGPDARSIPARLGAQTLANTGWSHRPCSHCLPVLLGLRGHHLILEPSGGMLRLSSTQSSCHRACNTGCDETLPLTNTVVSGKRSLSRVTA